MESAAVQVQLPESYMFACIAPYFVSRVPGMFVRTSWFQTIEEATDHAEHMLGVIAVEEIGRGIVWHCIDRAPEFARALNTL